MNNNKKNLRKYNPYAHLVFDNDYEEEVINYYNNYKNIYGDNAAFNKAVTAANDYAVRVTIHDFLEDNNDIVISIKELKEKIRQIKNIILITEKGSNTKKHIDAIDREVNKTINYKNNILKTMEKQIDELYQLFDCFDDNLFLDDAISDLKDKVDELVHRYEEIYSFTMNISMTKKINKMLNRFIDDKCRDWYLYEFYDIEVRNLIDKYKEIKVDNEILYLEWVSNLKNEYNQIKTKIKDIYSGNVYTKFIKTYDKLIDDLIEEMMNKNDYLKANDDFELDKLFSCYKSDINNYQLDEYYEYMLDGEKFNFIRELYEDKNRQFKRMIRNFNKNIRNKYSKRYANLYINEVNKKADDLIKECAKKINMPIPKNPWFIRKYLWADTENFVSEAGIKIRRFINTPLRKIVRLAMENKLIIEEMPKLDPNKQYIFVSTHYFTEDVIGLFAALDKQAFMLMGTTDQIENNPLMIAAMMFGFFHVDRLDKEDRKECFEKQNILIDKGTSFINYIGGGWENSENELQPPSYSGAYRTSKLKDALIVPVASYLVREDKKIYMRFGEPLDVRGYDENIGNDIIRDTLASMHYKQISKYSYPITDSKLNINKKIVSVHRLPYDQHKYYMDQIGDEYWKQPWTKPFAKEEIGPRKRKITTLEEVYGFIDNLSRDKLIELSSQLSTVMVRMDEMERYNVSKYLDSNYEKFKVKSLKKK